MLVNNNKNTNYKLEIADEYIPATFETGLQVQFSTNATCELPSTDGTAERIDTVETAMKSYPNLCCIRIRVRLARTPKQQKN